LIWAFNDLLQRRNRRAQAWLQVDVKLKRWHDLRHWGRLSTPAVYGIDDPTPNAFATGISPTHAAVIITTGLLAVTDREELEDVLGHEISHINNYDTRLRR
jgi:heat shock protein HtpX